MIPITNRATANNNPSLWKCDLNYILFKQLSHYYRVMNDIKIKFKFEKNLFIIRYQVKRAFLYIISNILVRRRKLHIPIPVPHSAEDRFNKCSILISCVSWVVKKKKSPCNQPRNDNLIIPRNVAHVGLHESICNATLIRTLIEPMFLPLIIDREGNETASCRKQISSVI